jgi:hypothetical protein
MLHRNGADWAICIAPLSESLRQQHQNCETKCPSAKNNDENSPKRILHGSRCCDDYGIGKRWRSQSTAVMAMAARPSIYRCSFLSSLSPANCLMPASPRGLETSTRQHRARRRTYRRSEHVDSRHAFPPVPPKRQPANRCQMVGIETRNQVLP